MGGCLYVPKIKLTLQFFSELWGSYFLVVQKFFVKKGKINVLLESKLILIKTLRKSTGHCKNLKAHIYFASLASTAQIGTI